MNIWLYPAKEEPKVPVEPIVEEEVENDDEEFEGDDEDDESDEDEDSEVE
jgi:hypothetical protein